LANPCGIPRIETLVSSPLTTAARVRQFNRFYTRQMGLLNAGLLESPFSLAEVRVLYELAHTEQPTAKAMANTLNLDEGYLSRLLRGLRHKRLVTSRASTHDHRQRWLALTSRGRRIFKALNARATGEIADMLRGLSEQEQEALVRSLGTVQSLLGDSESPTSVRPTVRLRSPVPGDLGWVVERHGELYWEEYGWDQDFERLVARIVGEFAASASDSSQRCWIATLDGRRAGCVFLMPASPEVARLRLLLVEPWARSHGLGTLLVKQCINAAREAGYKTLSLWTNDVLVSARRLYERAGLGLVKSEPHHSFGKNLVGQTWELAL
jgi:DNA-binding MarR family transcriptional regulator/N-acetylglutamate synthase-like GNAT family acetyltransferase